MYNRFISEEHFDRGRDFWIAGLVGLLGLALSLVGWGTLIVDRRDRLVAGTGSVARETREALELALSEQMEALTGLGGLWTRFGLRPEPEWTANVGERVDHVTGLTYLAWVDLDEPRNRITYGNRVGERPSLDAAEARRHSGQRSLVGPIRTASGEFFYDVYIPVDAPHEHAGVLVGRVEVQSFLGAVLRARARGHAISVSWNGEKIFSREMPSRDPWQRWWRAEEAVELPLAGQWQLSLRPTREYAAARLTPVPHYLLMAGTLLSVVLAALTHAYRLVSRQVRSLAIANQALERRGQELETRVAERTEALRDAVAELQAFNYSVSHDLRSPLGAILNFIAILEEDCRDSLDAEALGMLGRIRESAERALRLLRDLLRLSTAGRAELELERLDMTGIAREAYAQVTAAERAAGVDFQLDPLPEVVGDRALVGDVFVNLLSNALKYSRADDKRWIRVSGRIAGKECIYEVTDNGRGFDMRFADKVFGLFERLHGDREIEGTGVGLAIVRRIVSRHGGRVWVESAPDRGTRFSFALPAKEAA